DSRGLALRLPVDLERRDPLHVVHRRRTSRRAARSRQPDRDAGLSVLRERGTMKTTSIFIAGALAALVCMPAAAKVSQAEADRLGKDLTPIGAEKAGNKEGSIPAWDGGLTKNPPCYKGKPQRYCDPFADDKPKFTITKANLAQYKDRLSAGQQRMFEMYPDTYKMNVYQTRRTAAFPDIVYEYSKK